MISFRGTADTLVPYAGGSSSVVPGMPVTFLGAEGSSKVGVHRPMPGRAVRAGQQRCSRYSRLPGASR